MDITKISNMSRMMIKVLGTDEKYIDRKETLYYDESGNVKHFIIKKGKLNAETDTVFVLGGIEAESTISLKDLKKYLGKKQTRNLNRKPSVNPVL